MTKLERAELVHEFYGKDSQVLVSELAHAQWRLRNMGAGHPEFRYLKQSVRFIKKILKTRGETYVKLNNTLYLNLR